MARGYLYILKNSSFGANVLKIGLTTRTPDVRAKEIYAGSTGVPLPFEVAEAYSVADCALAEKRVHERLKIYRLSNRREFFRLTLQVSTATVLEVCTQINHELNVNSPQKFAFCSNEVNSRRRVRVSIDEAPDVADGQPIYHVAPGRLASSPIKRFALPNNLQSRAETLFQILAQINPVEREKWFEGFLRDVNPERELRIWERMAIAYLSLEHADDALEAYRAEAFALLLQRTWHPTAEVLALYPLKHFSRRNAQRLLDAYALKPKPVVVDRFKPT